MWVLYLSEWLGGVARAFKEMGSMNEANNPSSACARSAETEAALSRKLFGEALPAADRDQAAGLFALAILGEIVQVRRRRA